MARRVKTHKSTDTRTSDLEWTVVSLGRGLLILEALVHTRRGMTLSDVARKLSLPKSSTLDLLRTLTQSGYACREESGGRYFPGSRLRDLGKSASPPPANDLVLGHLSRLHRQTGLIVEIGTLEQDQVVSILRLSPNGGRRASIETNGTAEIHCSGLGKAILAFLPVESVERLIRKRGMTMYNANTIHSLDQLLRQLKIVRYRGFALENEETMLGFRSVAAPIFDSGGSVMAAVGVVGTIEQISSENLPQLAEAVMASAADITASNSDPIQSRLGRTLSLASAAP